VDQAVASFQGLFRPGDAQRRMLGGHHAVQRRVAAMQALDRGALRFLAELHGAAGHRQHQPPAARQLARRQAQQHGGRRRRAEAHEQAGGMESQLYGLGRIGGGAHPA